MSRLLIIAACCWVGGAWAQSPEEARARAQRQLEAEKAIFDSLQKNKGELLSTLELMEKLARDAADRVEKLSRQSQRVSWMLSVSERVDRMAREQLTERRRQMGPRLQALYRLTRKDPLGLMVSSESFAAMVRRGQAMRLVVQEDLRALEELGRAARFQRHAAVELTRIRDVSALQLLALAEAQQVAEQRKVALDQMLASVQTEAARSGQMLQELQQAERHLAALVAELKSGSGAGFRALRGRLPYPTRGMIEVGFGKVVNPRFNTVTVQKGLDFRARAGTPVTAVAPGKVVYAGWLKGYGNLLILDHGDGYHTLHGHLSSFSTAVGEQVAAGAKVAEVGDTGSLKGAYLYFEIRHQGNAIDPGDWLDETASP